MSRLSNSLRPFALLLTGVSLFLAAAASGPERAVAAEGSMLVLIGTYSPDTEEGIHCYRLNRETGELTKVAATTGVKNPSFLALHPNGKFVYAVSEIADFSGGRTGGVVAFAFDAGTGKLTRLNAQPSGGDGPCHVVVDRTGKCVLVANYGGGSVSSIPIQADGQLGPPGSRFQHEGSSITDRQKGPHAHSINVDPANRFAVAADLGLDKVLVYRLDSNMARLTPHDPPSTSVPPGSGPRHFAFHPSGKFAYVINELSSTVTALSFDAEHGRLTPLQTISTLPEGFEGSNSTAEVQVHPSGRFVYGSNRGHHSLAIFAVDPDTGRLTVVGHQSTGGETPRNFGVDPTGEFVLAANQQTNNVVVLRVDPKSGKLTPTGHEIQVTKPVCVKFLAVP